MVKIVPKSTFSIYSFDKLASAISKTEAEIIDRIGKSDGVNVSELEKLKNFNTSLNLIKSMMEDFR